MEEVYGLLQEDRFDECLQAAQPFFDSTDEAERFEARNVKGIIFMKQQRYNEALEMFKGCIEIDSSHPGPHYQKANALEQLKIWDEALAAYQTSIDNGYMLPESYLSRGVIYQRQGKCDLAQKEYLLAIANKGTRGEPDAEVQFEDLLDAHINLATCFRQLQLPDEAFDVLQDAIKIDNKNAEVHFLIGQVYQQKGQFDLAVKKYDEALAINPAFTKAVISKGQSLRDNHKYDEAIKIYSDAITKDPSNVDVQNELGNVLFQQGKYDKALDSFNAVLKVKGDNLSALNNKALALKHLNRNPEALECLNQVINAKPDDVDALINKGSLLDDMKQYKEAIEVYDKAISINENKADVYNNKGIALKNLNRNEDALQCFKQATDLDKHYILGFANKAQVEQLLGRGPEALASLRQANKLLDDPLATKSLSESHVKYIKKSVESIIQLEQQFHAEAEALELALQEETSAEVSPAQKQILQQYRELKEQKTKVAETEFKKIQAPQGAPASQPTADPNAAIMAQLQELKKQMEQLKKENMEIKKEVQEQKVKVEETEKKQEEMKQVMQDAGVYDTAKIKAGWEKYRKDDPDLYDYTKAFYWTMSNFCDAYRVASTGALQTNVEHTVDSKQKTGVAIAKGALSIGAKLAENLPLVGGIISGIKSAIDSIYAKVKDKRYEDRINSIVKIITNNEDPDAQSSEDFSKVLALAALEIADRKRLEIQAKKLEWENPPPIGSIKKAFEFFMGKIDELKARALGEKVEIYTSVGGKAALEDVTLLLVFMTKNHKEIIEDTKNGKKLYVIISDAVHKRKILDILQDLDMNDLEKANKVAEEAKETLEGNAEKKGDQATAKVVPLTSEAPPQAPGAPPPASGAPPPAKNEKEGSSCCVVM